MTRPAPLVEYVTRPRPYGKPAASATPRDEPDPPHRNQPAAEEHTTEPVKQRPLSVADFAPDAVRLHQHIERLAARDSASGDITRGRGGIGKDEFGRTPKGALDWHHRPVPVGRDGRLIMGAQQDTPVHHAGAVFADSKDTRRRSKITAEEAAHRQVLAAALEAVGGDAKRLHPGQLAAVLALSQRQVRRKVERTRKGARSQRWR